MAIVKCPKCGQMVSDKASSCPHCKAFIKDKITYNGKSKGFSFLIGCLAFFVIHPLLILLTFLLVSSIGGGVVKGLPIIIITTIIALLISGYIYKILRRGKKPTDKTNDENATDNHIGKV